MALSGVRSSWLILARNCDLCWLATSSWWLFSPISVNRCAFWIASTDCAAKVCRTSVVCLGNSPGALRRTTSAPTTPPAPTQRHHQQRAIAGAENEFQRRRCGFVAQIRDLYHGAGRIGLADRIVGRNAGAGVMRL